MTSIVYPALASHDEAGGYVAHFPDLPGCTAAGATLGELLEHAREALLATLRRLEDEGQEWPQARPLSQLQAEAGGAVAILVDVQVEDAPVRVNISIGEGLLRRLDAAAEAGGMTRSGFISHAVKGALGERARFASPDLEKVSRQLQDELSSMGRRISEALGPDSAFSRRMAELDERVMDGVQKAAENLSAAIARRRSGATASEGVDGQA